MDLDPQSIITPARVKVLLLPVGHVRQSKFAGFVRRLQHVNVVRLGDVSPDSRPHRTMFSPLAFPEGRVLYDLSTSLPPPSHLELAPFEIYREPMVVVGIADGVDAGLITTQSGSEKGADNAGGGNVPNVDGLRLVVRSLEELIDGYPKALVHQILVFDHDERPMPERVYPVPSLAKSRATTIKTVMCDLTSRLLAEMATYAKNLQTLPSLSSPNPSASVSALNGSGSALPNHMTDSSRAGSSRSFSPINDRPKADHRMSLPADLSSSSASGPPVSISRPSSPPRRVQTPPASLNISIGSSALQSPPKVSNHDRAGSRDRSPQNGLGAGSLGERERTKGKGRIGVVVGAMYLLAGRWPDAVKELLQSASIARNNSDYLWHAKAMDYMLICHLMYAWAGMDFRIPENFFLGTEKPGSNSSKSTKHAASSSLPDLNASKAPDAATRATSLRTLTTLLPDLTNNILNLYSRAWAFTDEKLPPLAFSQSAVRFTKLLSAIYVRHGVLDDILLGHLVLNTSLPPVITAPKEAPTFLSKGDIVEFLFRAYPRPPSESSMHPADHTAILAAIASVLSDLGYHRKKAFVVKELLAGLLPALVQARKDGAAEMGVHPAASLASLSAAAKGSFIHGPVAGPSDSEQGMRDFLSLVCQAYFIKAQKPNNSGGGKMPLEEIQNSSNIQSASTTSDLAEAAATRVLQQATTRIHGSLDLKLDILRSCINVCEALPDLGGTLQYSAALLRVGGSGIAPGPDSSDGSPNISIEEQVRLVNNISRTLSAARQLGLEHPEVDYWDDFLIRGIEIVHNNTSRSLHPHGKNELEITETINERDKTPFIYNPYLKPKATAVVEPLLVAKEEALFRITLQNLFDFDLAVERVSLVSSGVPLVCEAQATVIGPYRTQTMLLSGIPQASGSLTIYGSRVKIRGCSERDFFTFTEPWTLKTDVKGRHASALDMRALAPNAPDVVTGNSQGSNGPIPSNLALDILEEQPNVVMQSSSLYQSAVMLLEGETKTATIRLRNISRKTLVDLLMFSFEDSTSQRASQLTNQELSAVESYELELSSTHKQSLRWLRKTEDRDLRIEPGGDISVDIEVFGKSSLSHGSISVDYAHLGIPREQIKDQFYTRQLVIPLTITVNASVDIVCSDIIALPTASFSSGRQQHEEDSARIDHSTEDRGGLSHFNKSTPQCLLLIDLHNSWSKTLIITFEVSDLSTAQPTIHIQSLHPNATERIPLHLPRLYLSYPYAPIPSLNPATKRQFVVSSTKSSPTIERTLRETFWYRESLLSHLKATWSEPATSRTGSIDLRSIQLKPHMLSCLRLPDLGISMSVSSAEPPSLPNPSGTTTQAVKQVAPTTFTVPALAFLTLHTHLHNRSPTPIRAILRLQPTLANQPQAAALDLNKKLLVNGLLQRVLQVIEPGEQLSVETGFLVLSPGRYEWGASVEETIAQERKSNDEKDGRRKRAATGDMEGLGEVGRRTWVADERCVVVASDEEEGEKDTSSDAGGDEDSSVS